jgi:hypothetical protein
MSYIYHIKITCLYMKCQNNKALVKQTRVRPLPVPVVAAAQIQQEHWPGLAQHTPRKPPQEWAKCQGPPVCERTKSFLWFDTLYHTGMGIHVHTHTQQKLHIEGRSRH